MIRNATSQTLRRVDLTYSLAHSVDVSRAEKCFDAILREHPKVLEEPASSIRIHKLTESGVEFIVRPWVRTEDYWDVYWDLNREVKIRLEAEDLALAAPRRDVRLRSQPPD